MRIDTGAEVSILPYNLYNELKPKPVLEKSGIKIETFGGFCMKLVGMIIVNCEVNNKVIKGKLIVVNNVMMHGKEKNRDHFRLRIM